MNQPKTKDMQLVSLATPEPCKANSFALDGVLYDIGRKVIKWDERGGFSFYKTNVVTYTDEHRHTGKETTKIIKGRRYSKRRGGIGNISQFFIHHSGGDGQNPSGMYETLHNRRKLSVQFAIEDDGRIYQFGDAADCAWHAGRHNHISIGVECCLFPLVKRRPDYYSPERNKRTKNLPHDIGFDTIHGKRIKVFKFTKPQVAALVSLAAGVWAALGRHTGGRNKQVTEHGQTYLLNDFFDLSPCFPRTKNNEIPRTVFDKHIEHVGLIGHLQCTKNKIDPAGFPWELFEDLVWKDFLAFKDALDKGGL